MLYESDEGKRMTLEIKGRRSCTADIIGTIRRNILTAKEHEASGSPLMAAIYRAGAGEVADVISIVIRGRSPRSA